MKYIFIIQGDGRGHLTQAIALADMLRRNGHEIQEVLIGKSKIREIPDFFYEKIGAKIRSYETPSFVFKKDKKHIHLLKTLLYNVNPKRLRKYKKSIEMINERIKQNNPDIVVNFYEILAGLTHLRFSFDIPFINIGHQYLIKHPDYTHAKESGQKLMFYRLHTLLSGIGASKTLALSFYPMKECISEKIVVVPPLLRKEVLELTPIEGNFILGYMLNQGYEEEVKSWHKKNPQTELNFFWDKEGVPNELTVDSSLMLHTLNDEKFLNYMSRCKGYITTAGFESVCEAYYLNKPIMLIPVHIEQEINAADALSCGIGVVADKFDISILLSHIETKKSDNTGFKKWVDSAEDIFLRHLTSPV